MLDDLCTSGLDGQLDGALVNHFREKVDVVCADKASNEQVAGLKISFCDVFLGIKREVV